MKTTSNIHNLEEVFYEYEKAISDRVLPEKKFKAMEEITKSKLAKISLRFYEQKRTQKEIDTLALSSNEYFDWLQEKEEAKNEFIEAAAICQIMQAKWETARSLNSQSKKITQ